MTSEKIRQKFLVFFKERGHTIIPSSSLIPDDSSVLLTTAGMQQFVPYLSGKVKSPYQRACSVQKCMRAGGKHNDLDEIGDDTHHTFFEMLGNWSFGDSASPDGIGPNGYFKKEAINYALEFLLRECKIPEERLVPTIFKGENGIPRDEEAYNLWLEKGFSKDRIFEFGMKDNFWGPTADVGPCGPSSEIHYDTGQPCERGDKCNLECSCGRYMEIWNLVFMEYNKNERGEYEPLPQKNIDTGIGFERLTAILQNKKSAYETDLFEPIMVEINKIALKATKKIKRIIADHMRAICFMIADGITPSNTDRGYVLRSLLRRLIVQIEILDLEEEFLNLLVKIIINNYGNVYPELRDNKENIFEVIKNENEKYRPVFKKGLKRFNEIIKIKESEFASEINEGQEIPIMNLISVDDVFDLHSTYGFSVEIIKDLAYKKGFFVDKNFRDQFEKKRKKHQEISRAGAEKKFGGHGLGETRVFSKEDEEKSKKLHTATHLLHQALQDVLGSETHQMGSDITLERLRFDFNYSQKLTSEQIKQIEDIVNQKIKENLPIKCEEMELEKAIAAGARAFFKAKYEKNVKVFSIGDYSKEICAGPHTERTGELGKFKITSEQSSGAGVRRVKAILE